MDALYSLPNYNILINALHRNYGGQETHASIHTQSHTFIFERLWKNMTQMFKLQSESLRIFREMCGPGNLMNSSGKIMINVNLLNYTKKNHTREHVCAWKRAANNKNTTLPRCVQQPPNVHIIQYTSIVIKQSRQANNCGLFCSKHRVCCVLLRLLSQFLLWMLCFLCHHIVL